MSKKYTPELINTFDFDSFTKEEQEQLKEGIRKSDKWSNLVNHMLKIHLEDMGVRVGSEGFGKITSRICLRIKRLKNEIQQEDDTTYGGCI